MALIKCPECGKKISNKATVCIHCGCPIEDTVNENIEITETITVDAEKHETVKKVIDKAKLKKTVIIAALVVGAIVIIATLVFSVVLKPAYEDAIMIYNDAVAIYNEKVAVYGEKSVQIATENQKLTAAIDELQSVVSSGEKPYDPNAIPNANTAINEGKIALIEIPKWEDKSIKAAEDYNIFQANTMKKDAEHVKDYATELTGIIESMQIPDHTEVIEVINKGKKALEFSIKQMKQVTCPSESFVLERITNIRDQAGMVDVIALTEDNDPENYIGKAGWYTAKIIFRHRDVEHYGLESGLLSLSEVGNPAGGCVEVYRTEEDAQRRADELKSQEGTARSPGARVICGTMVIRVSDDLKASYQQELLNLIANEMVRMGDVINSETQESPSTESAETQDKDSPSNKGTNENVTTQTQSPSFTGGVCSYLVSYGNGTPPDNKTEFIDGEEVCFTGRISGISGTHSVTFIATFPDGTSMTDRFDAMNNDVIGYGWVDCGVGVGNFKVIFDATGQTLGYYEFIVYKKDTNQTQTAIEAAEAFRQDNPDRILSVYALYEHLSGLGYSDSVCEEVCFGNPPEGFDDGSAMYDYERIIKFSNQGYSRNAIINYYLGTLSYEDATYLVDECLSGRKLTYTYVDGSLELVEH